MRCINCRKRMWTEKPATIEIDGQTFEFCGSCYQAFMWGAAVVEDGSTYRDPDDKEE